MFHEKMNFFLKIEVKVVGGIRDADNSLKPL